MNMEDVIQDLADFRENITAIKGEVFFEHVRMRVNFLQLSSALAELQQLVCHEDADEQKIKAAFMLYAAISSKVYSDAHDTIDHFAKPETKIDDKEVTEQAKIIISRTQEHITQALAKD